MLRNYFLTAIRNFKKNKIYSLLNIVGLGIGIASCLFVYTIINFEFSFDDWHENRNEIYRVTRHYNGDNHISYNASIPYPTGDEIIAKVPDFKNVVQFHGPTSEKIQLTDPSGNLQVFRQNGSLFTDANFFEVMDFKIKRGASSEILNEPFKIYLSEEIALKYFGDQNPIGQIMKLDNKEDMEIVGIIEDCPQNTNLPYKVIISLPTLRKRHPDFFNSNWNLDWAYSTYVQVDKNANIKDLESKLDQMMAPHIDEDDRDKLEMHLQPLLSIHNDEKYGDSEHYTTPSIIIWAFIILGGLLMGTSCLNFINLTTAQATQRAKEVGVRKTLGGSKSALIFQFLAETFIIVCIATFLGLTLGQILISWLNSFLEMISYELTYSSEIVGFSILMMFAITFLAGFYPSMILARYKPVEALNNQIRLRKGSGNFNLRRSLVVAQFTFTNLMLIATLIIAAQMDFVRTQDLGFNKDNLVTVDFPDDSFEKLKSIGARFEEKSYIAGSVRQYSTPFAGSNWNTSFKEPGGEYIDGNNANMKFGDEEYIDFYEIGLISGRNLPGIHINDSTFDALANRTLIGKFGWTPEEALGKKIRAYTNTFRIVGVINDFNVYSLQNAIKPVMVSMLPKQMDQLALRLKKAPTAEEIKDIEATFREFFPDELFEMSVFEDKMAQFYLIENMLNQILQYVSILTILLSVMGLFGLVSFMATKNAKSIGIRKVFGAPVNSILQIFAKEYVILMVLAFLVAAPLAYLLVNVWLDEFVYRIDITPRYFVLGFLLSLSIAIITVGYRSFKAAVANPIDSLRYE